MTEHGPLLLAGTAGLPLAPRMRLAPTPSGLLHLGNAAAFLLTARLAYTLKGTLQLRIDDLDLERTRPEYVDDIFLVLQWLGIVPDKGPRTAEELASTWSQHLRLPRYHELIETLRDQGRLYACTCSRAQVRSLRADGVYPGTCRNALIPFDAPDVVWRYALPDNAVVRFQEWPGRQRSVDLTTDMGDPVLLQRNGRPAYQIASLADDVDQRIDLIVRGEDLLPSTALQLHLAEVLHLNSFLSTVFIHHPLIADADGGKLSKSQGARSALVDGAQEGRVAVERVAENLWRAVRRS